MKGEAQFYLKFKNIFFLGEPLTAPFITPGKNIKKI